MGLLDREKIHMAICSREGSKIICELAGIGDAYEKVKADGLKIRGLDVDYWVGADSAGLDDLHIINEIEPPKDAKSDCDYFGFIKANLELDGQEKILVLSKGAGIMCTNYTTQTMREI